ncbi:unnamed protein product [Blepharisma stoltei]|uniref:Uncharacterized protein n=1 Tax=Blepharisma stoltei TaxID=1481888 RepID=A0AAU9JRQ1_9CILI|nr:unnamed protein product [Blepharisma stoltei]
MNIFALRSSSADFPKRSSLPNLSQQNIDSRIAIHSSLRESSEKFNPKIPAFSQTTRRTRRFQSEDGEKEAVGSLEKWEENVRGIETVENLIEAQQRLKRRLSHADVVEQHLSLRKSKERSSSSVNKITPKNSFGQVQETAEMRLIKKQEEYENKEKSKFNKSYEDELKKIWIELEKEYVKVNDRRELLRKECLEMREEMKNVQDAYSEWKNDVAEAERKAKLNKRKNQEEIAAILSRKQNRREELNRKEAETNLIIEQILKEIKNRTDELEELDDKAGLLRKQINSVQAAQSTHFYGLLLEGKDTRSEGLKWIIKALWKLNEIPQPEHFPRFLDTLAINSLNLLAKKSLEIDEQSEILLSQAERKSNTPAFTERNRWNNIQERLTKLTQNIRMKKPEYKIDKHTKRMNLFWEIYDEDETAMKKSKERFEGISGVMILENILTKLRNEYLEMQENEIKRLTRECSLNNYEIKYKINLRDLISVIIGIERVDKYMVYVNKNLRDLTNKVQTTKTFKFSACNN